MSNKKKKKREQRKDTLSLYTWSAHPKVIPDEIPNKNTSTIKLTYFHLMKYIYIYMLF